MSDPDLTVVMLLGFAALAAGYVDAIVGGGGLIQLPALVIALPGAAPVQLLAANKFSSFCGTSAAALTYARKVRPKASTTLALMGSAFVGSLGGATVARHVPQEAFEPIVVAAMVLVGGWVLARPKIGAVTALRWHGWPEYVGLVGIGAVIGFYDGALGPGTGSFLTVAMAGLIGYSFLDASARARMANWATNAAALAVFIPAGAVMWRVALVMGVCNLCGGWLGARTALKVGSGFVRVVFLIVVAAFAVTIVAGWLL